jgi:hypothetical protein
MHLWSFIPSLVLFGLALMPLAGRSSPVMLGTLAWALLWAANGALGFTFIQSFDVMVLIFVGNLLFYFGGIIASLGFASPSKHDSYESDRARQAMSIGRSFRVRAGWILVAMAAVALEAGFREMGHNNGIISILLAQDQLFELLRLSKAGLSEDGEWAIPRGISVATAALSGLALTIGVDIGSSGARYARAQIFLAAALVILTFLLSAGTGVRAFLVVIAFLFGSAVLAAATYTSRGRNVITRKWIGWASLGLGAFLVWVVIVQSARRQDATFSNVLETLDYLRTWFAGYIPALTGWYMDVYSPTEHTGGALLTRAISGPLGLGTGEGFDAPLGFTVIGDGASSNAMTIFRVLWGDFGVIGGSLLSLFAGFLCQRVYHSAVKVGGLWIPLLAGVYAGVLYSINFWFFGYGARVAGIVIAVGILWASVRVGSRANDRVGRGNPPQTREL